MRQVSTIKTYGTFEELTKERQRVEIENYKDINVNHDWYTDTISEFEQALGVLGFREIRTEFSGFWSQGDGASFTGEFYLPSDDDTLEMRLSKFIAKYPWICSFIERFQYFYFLTFG